jgi:hypothetical protein
MGMLRACHSDDRGKSPAYAAYVQLYNDKKESGNA